MTWFALQSLFLILGAFVLGVLVGWLFWGRQERQERIVVLHGDVTASRTTSPPQRTRVTEAAAPDGPAPGTGSAAPAPATAEREPTWLHARRSGGEPPAGSVEDDAGRAAATPSATPAPAPAPTAAAAAAASAAARASTAASATSTPDVVDLREPAPDVVDLRDEPATGTPPAPAHAAPTATAGTGDAPEADAAPDPDDAPAPEPAPEAADELARIEGVSSTIESALHDSGITSYAQLAACDEFRLRGILRKAGLRFVPSLPSWPEQADLLAQGDDAGFAALSARVAADPRTAGTA